MFTATSISATSSLSSLASGSSDTLFPNQSDTAAAGARRDVHRFTQWSENEHSTNDTATISLGNHEVGHFSNLSGAFRWNSSERSLMSNFPMNPPDVNHAESSPFWSLAPIQALPSSEAISRPKCRLLSQTNLESCQCSTRTSHFGTPLHCCRCASPDTELTPTKSRFTSSPAHMSFPSIASASYDDSSQTVRSYLFNSNHSPSSLQHNPVGESNDTSSSPLLQELTGDVRTVDLQSFDQKPVYAWL